MIACSHLNPISIAYGGGKKCPFRILTVRVLPPAFVMCTCVHVALLTKTLL